MTADLLVIDMTSRVGMDALGRLIAPVTGPQQRSWLGLRLGRMPRPTLDWYRPRDSQQLLDIPLDGREPVLLLGAITPDALHALFAWEAFSRVPASAFAVPGAARVLAELHQASQTTLPLLRIHKLPSNSEHVLWFCLMEQFQAILSRKDFLSTTGGATMATPKEAVTAAMQIEGATAMALVDYRSGMVLAKAGSGLDVDLAAAGNTQVVQAKLKTAASLGLKDSIEDILITLTNQYHLIRLAPHNPGLFLYLVLDRQNGNLALARYKLAEIERNLRV